MNLSTKKGIYGTLSVLAPAVGTVCGLLGAVLVSVGNMYEPTIKEREQISYRGYGVHFHGEDAQRLFIDEYVIYALFAFIAFVAIVVGLTILSGSFKKNEEGRTELNLWDRIWTEVHLGVFSLSCIGAVCLAAPVIEILPHTEWLQFFDPLTPDEFVFGMRNETIAWLCIAGMLVCIEIAILTYLALVKKIKARKFFRTSLIGKICIWIYGEVKDINFKLTAPGETDDASQRKLKWLYIGVPIGMVLLAMTWIGAVADIALILAFIPNRIAKYREIRHGVDEVKSGNLTYQIPVETNYKTGKPSTEFDELAEKVNQIALATNNAVQNELKNQRMKTDLISNVSHDLKTPLTSMISYLDILKKEGLDSSSAEEYLDIAIEKTQKLKTLTEDLFEAAKASSGNIPCDITTIDLAQMIEQELAEMSDVLAEKNLNVIKSVKIDDTNVKADGRLLSRVIENLLGNIGKYALDHSRVYVDLIEGANNSVQLDVKNISRDQLNISPDELMERFTRGDESRNTEGSGLGLAIAKDLTRLMGGTFKLSIDGDMFKASVVLNRD